MKSKVRSQIKDIDEEIRVILQKHPNYYLFEKRREVELEGGGVD